jgi:hypothetical protein
MYLSHNFTIVAEVYLHHPCELMIFLPFNFLAETTAAGSNRIPHHSLIWSSTTSQATVARRRSARIHATVHYRPRVVHQPLSFSPQTNQRIVCGTMEPKAITCWTSVIACLPFCIIMVQKMAEVVSRHSCAHIKSFTSLKTKKWQAIKHFTECFKQPDNTNLVHSYNNMKTLEALIMFTKMTILSWTVKQGSRAAQN